MMRTDFLFRILTILAIIVLTIGISMFAYNLLNNKNLATKSKIRIAVIDPKKIENEYLFFKDIRKEMDRMNTETDEKVVSILKRL